MHWRLAIPGIALTLAVSLPSGAQDMPPSRLVFPLFVDGASGGMTFKSALKIMSTNPSNPSMKCELVQRQTSASFVGIGRDRYFPDVFDGTGGAAAVTGITLDQFLPWEVLRSTAQSALESGYLTLSCSGSVHTELQISLIDHQGSKVGEAAILPADEGRSFEFLIDRRDGTRLGFSLMNDSAFEGMYAVIARDEFNQEVDWMYDILGPWSQVSGFIDEALHLPANFAGRIELVGIPSGRSYAVGLQFTGPVFATVTPIVRSAPLPAIGRIQ